MNMKYKTNRNLSEMWGDMYDYFYALEKRAMEQSGIHLTPYGKEVCASRTEVFLEEIRENKEYRLVQACKGNKYALKLRIRI